MCSKKSREVRQNMSGIHKELTMPRAQLVGATAFEVILVPVVIFLSNGIRVLHQYDLIHF